MNELILEKLNEYQVKNALEEQQALKEITQEIILYAFSKTDFFKHTYFCGGTALRIIHKLNRFSEDLDFATIESNRDFSFDYYMPEVLTILSEFGLDMTVKKAKDDSFVKARELKEDSEKWKITFPSNKKLKQIVIKLEIDTHPPLGAIIETKRLDFPILHQVQLGNIETLFAGKIHALLCRQYVKGRDWYDFLWYVKNKKSINLEFLENALFQMGPWQDKVIKNFDQKYVVKLLNKKIESLDFKLVAEDVKRFIRPYEVDSLGLWNREYFLEKSSSLNDR